jgi:hypothetical protein
MDTYFLPVLTHEEIEIGVTKGVVRAVKAYNDRTHCGVSVAMKAVKQYFNNNHLEFGEVSLPKQEFEVKFY